MSPIAPDTNLFPHAIELRVSSRIMLMRVMVASCRVTAIQVNAKRRPQAWRLILGQLRVPDHAGTWLPGHGCGRGTTRDPSILSGVSEELTTLYRPVGRIELDLIRESGFRQFPPRPISRSFIPSCPNTMPPRLHATGTQKMSVRDSPVLCYVFGFTPSSSVSTR